MLHPIFCNRFRWLRDGDSDRVSFWWLSLYPFFSRSLEYCQIELFCICYCYLIVKRKTFFINESYLPWLFFCVLDFYTCRGFLYGCFMRFLAARLVSWYMPLSSQNRTIHTQVSIPWLSDGGHCVEEHLKTFVNTEKHLESMKNIRDHHRRTVTHKVCRATH